MAHELCHVLHGLHTETLPASGVHDHSDYVVNGDQEVHVDDVDLTCGICTLSMTGVLTLEKLAANPVASVYHLDGRSLRFERHRSHFSIRGPPLHMTIS